MEDRSSFHGSNWITVENCNETLEQVSLTDTENKSMEYAAKSVQDWADNDLKNRARVAKEEIIAKLVAHCNANDVTIATGEDAQVTQAFDLGVVLHIHQMHLYSWHEALRCRINIVIEESK